MSEQLAAQSPAPTSPPSQGLQLLNAALVEVKKVVAKADETYQMLQDNLQKINSQRVGLAYQVKMLTDLIETLTKLENK